VAQSVVFERFIGGGGRDTVFATALHAGFVYAVGGDDVGGVFP